MTTQRNLPKTPIRGATQVMSYFRLGANRRSDLAWYVAELLAPQQPLGRTAWTPGSGVACLGIEGELIEQCTRGGNEALGIFNCLPCFPGCSRFGRQARVFQLVTAASHVGKGSEPLAELCYYRALYRVVASLGSGAQALLGQQRGTGESGGVVCQHVSAVGVGLDQAFCRAHGAGGLRQQRGAVGGSSSDNLQVGSV